MIIRSQDKTKIFNFEQIRKIDCGNGMIVADSTSLLGEYSTEEKAIKVLDMIQKEYGRHYYGEGGPLTTMNHYVEPFAFIPPKVFQMPSDEEVEV